MKLLLLLLFCYPFVFSQDDIEPPEKDIMQYVIKPPSTYLVMAPNTIRAGRPFDVSISITDIDEPVQVYAIIKLGLKNVMQAVVQVTSSRPAKAKFMIPNDFPKGSYSLVVFGRISSLDFLFLNETYLKYYTSAVLSFIQTDKPIYKAKDLVRFRAINVDPDLRPYNSKVNISIYDGKMNKVKQWLNVKNEFGVIAQQMQLSDQPVLGDWTIETKIEDIIKKTQFTVEEYVLPKFETTVETAKYVLWKYTTLYITVKSKYTFDKPVFGTCIVQTKSSNSITVIRTGEMNNGVAYFTIPLKSFLSPKQVMEDLKLDITANCTDSATNSTRKGSTSLDVYKEDVKLKVLKSFEVYKPGLPVIFSVLVTSPDDVPVFNSKYQLNVTYNLMNRFDGTKTRKTDLYEVPESGIVEVTLKSNLKETIDDIEIVYNQVKIKTYLESKSVSKSGNFIQIRGNSKTIKMGEKPTFIVSTTEPRSDINFVVLTQERIITTGLLKMKNKTELRFTLKINRDMSPVSRIVVYYTRKDGEVVADVIGFEVEGFFQNQVDLDFCNEEGVSFNESKNAASPGEEVFLKGHASPNSFVGISAVDQSVVLLKEQNDITEKVITDELKQYSGINAILDKPYASFGFFATNAMDVFWNAGVIVMTNADVYSPNKLLTQEYHYKKHIGLKRPVPMYSAGPSVDQEYMEESESDKSVQSDSSASLQNENELIIRKSFPETWLWLNIQINENGEFNENATVPDTITSWVANAVSVDKINGLGITNVKPKLRVFRQFFVSSNLPYSIVRGEVLHLQVLVFSYIEGDAEVSIELEKSEEFTLADLPGSNNTGFVRKIKVENGKPGSVMFPIIALVAGSIQIKVTGQLRNNSLIAQDAEVKNLLVKAEGVIQHFSSSVLIDLRQDNHFSKILALSIPSKDVVEGSPRAEVSTSGDLFGNAINNLDNLVRVPGGCGEQNLVGFVSNVLILNYLQATKQLTPELRSRVINYLEAGYQSQLRYRRKDDSFSVFGEIDESGSTWLTAFVIKAFVQAKSYIDIDQKIINSSIDWLKKRQNPEGFFEEPGKIFNTGIQGGNFGAVTLTAYVISALQNIPEYSGINKIVSSAKNYLEEQVESLSEPYSLAVVSLSLTITESAKSSQAFNKLQELAKNEGDLIYWSQIQTVESDIWKWSPFQTRLIDIETTSYALLTYIRNKQVADAVPIAKWLNSKRNSFGGFQSTQDTVMGLEALTAYAAETFSSKTDIKVQFKVGKKFFEAFDVNADNLLLHQSAVLPKVFSKIQVSAKGSGSCLAQISWQYNINTPKETDFFYLNVTPEITESIMKLKVCVAHQENSTTGMVLLEVFLPSGYVADTDALTNLKSLKVVKRVDTENGDSKIIVYFSELLKEKKCLHFVADRTIVVEKLKDPFVTIYEYYSPEKRTTQFYKLHNDETDDEMLK